MTQRNDDRPQSPPPGEHVRPDPFGPGPGESPEADTPQPTQRGPAGAETDSGDQTTEAGH
ncbi:hypothetical protein [Deinococcus phoenicis]|uniref:hypothetical protein n=1 Tax=Deinococcus phoenicis TaxID=1476583 RepID=UPI0012694613|nr:hypothetical protein [Deinococcus phoenicis]